MGQDERRLTPEEIADDVMVEKMAAARSVRQRLLLRALLTAVILGMGGSFLWGVHSDLAYYLGGRETPIDLGDLRSESFDSEKVKQLKTNDYVKFSNDVIMFEEYVAMGDEGVAAGAGGGTTRVYYSPLTHFVVATPRPIPDKTPYRERDSLIELDAWGLDLVTRKLVFAWDLMVSIDGEGRVIRYEDVSGEALPALAFMSNSSHDPKEDMFLFMDGEKPGGRPGLLWIVIIAAGIMLATVAFLTDAVVKYAKSR